ncbi:hypothetical protein EI94DRAFT_934475 [Lactarius quietus]|nr:hypothetical protein EI94DRAFT_934475 [Lactarius quietus]
MPGAPIVDLQNTYGAVFVALLLTTMLTGFEIVQAWIYFGNYWDQDKKIFKSFVGFLTVIDILSTVIGAYSVYWYLVLNFGNIQALEYRVWATNVQTMLGIIPGCSVQLYYVRRIYILSQSIIFPIIIVPLSLGGTIFGFVIISKASFIKSGSESERHLVLRLATLWMSAIAFVDISITAVMSWALYRRRTGFARTDSMITTLMAYTMNSGLLLSALGIAMTISLAVSPSTLIYVPFLWMLSKCYMNSLYAMLNSRNYVRDRSTTDNPYNAHNTYNLSSIRREPLDEVYGSKSSQPAVTVTVQRSTTSNFARSQSGHIIGSTFEDTDPV